MNRKILFRGKLVANGEWAWGELGGRARGEIVSLVERQMKTSGYEGQRVVENFGGMEPFAQRFYSMLQQGRPVAEQWTPLIPDIQGLMDEIEAWGSADANGRQYSLSPGAYDNLISREANSDSLDMQENASDHEREKDVEGGVSYGRRPSLEKV